MNVSIVIPAHNEAGRIGPTLEAIRAWAHRTGWEVEVIVVAAGCADETAEVASAAQPGPLNVQVLCQPTGTGKGNAVRRGMQAASGDAMLFTDADLAAPIEEAEKLLAALADGADVAIGSRAMACSALTPPQPPLRRLGGRVFRAVRCCLVLPEIGDTQCGLKAFTRQAARELFARQTEDGFAFDVELLLLARELGCEVREVGITWGHRPGSRVSLLRDAPAMLKSLLRLRRRFGR